MVFQPIGIIVIKDNYDLLAGVMGSKRPSELERRAIATRATMERYRTKPFDWGNKATCLHMARFHLRQMGHKPPPIPAFTSALGAKSALKRAGFDSVVDLMDSMFPRIGHASMLVGDLAAMAGDAGMEGIGVCAGEKILAWHEDAPDGIKPLIVSEIVAAWRI